VCTLQPPPGNPVGRSACWIAVSQTLFAVTNIAAAGLVTSNENVTNEDKTPAVSSTPAPAGYFMMPGLFLHPPTASR
jgi:hypothetical protein